MASYSSKSGHNLTQFPPTAWDGLTFANIAVEFAGLAWMAQQKGNMPSRLHLYALAIELGFKSLALRSGATVDDCQKAGHRISKMIKLVEIRGVSVPPYLKQRLNDDQWFRNMLGIRYPRMILVPSFEDTVFFHSNYPEMIAQILEIPCSCPLTFKGDAALVEIKSLFSDSH